MQTTNDLRPEQTVTSTEVTAGRPRQPAAPSAAPTRSRRRMPFRIVVPVLLVVLGCVAASHGDEGRIDSWGLIRALPPLYLVSGALLTVSFFVELIGRRRPSGLVLAAHLVGLVVLLHGAPAFLEEEPRFPTAWLHAGFVGQILDHGVSAPKVDARFSWPGFFAAAAAVTGAGGLHDALPLLRWAPTVMVLLYLVPLHVIGRHLTGSARATWLGLWFFVLLNWVGQDYFAPQTLGLVIYLSAVAVLVSFFRIGRQLPLGARLSAWRYRFGYDGRPDLPVGPRLRICLVVLLVAIAAALAVSHQLTPIALVLATTLLVLAGRSRLVLFPLVAGILTLGWISVGTTAYWVGHIGTIFGGVGDVSSVVAGSVGERIGGSHVHRGIVNLRLGVTAEVWLAAALAAVLLAARRRLPLTLLVLTAAPFAMALQDYGSEGMLRIYLFSTPFACLMVGQWVATVCRRFDYLLVAAMALFLLPVFLVSRYGNESYERVRPTEVQAMQAVYDLAPRGSELVSLTTQVPWRFTHAADYGYSRPEDAKGFLAGDPIAVRNLVPERTAETRQTYLIVTTSQLVYAYEALGQPANWFAEVAPMLTPRNGYRLVYANADASVYRYEARP